VPTLSLGPPSTSEGLLSAHIAGVTIFYHPGLQTKPGCEAITVRLRNFFILRWLELEGARSTPLYEGE
jgi:hypothetical protein